MIDIKWSKNNVEMPPEKVAVFRSRIMNATTDLVKDCKLGNFACQVSFGDQPANMQANNENGKGTQEEPGTKKIYTSTEPLYSFDQLVVPAQVMTELVSAVDLARVEGLVFDTWGLRKIEPFPRTALNFHGAPGTGKTMAAHALANRLGRKILVASYAEIESKYHGDGPKNVKAIFNAAQEGNSILFIDEADSLLSKRLTSVTQGSEQAINSMRSQLLICLESYSGAVIFSTNLVQNYDKAFETRVKHIEFTMPDEECRKLIWRIHIPEKLPIDADLSIDELATIDDVCGRDIKNAVIDAAVRAAINTTHPISTNDFIEAIQRIKTARINSIQNKQLSFKPSDDVRERIIAKLNSNTGKSAGTCE